MRRLFVIIATVLSLIAASCGSDSVTTGGELPPTPRPAPTVPGEIIDVEPPEVQAETVLIGISIDEAIQVHALPGIDQPLAGDVAPGTTIEPLNQVFETDDGLVWWQVRAGAITGWIQPSIAYRGPTQDITDQVLQQIGADATYGSAEEATAAVAELIGADQGAGEIVVVSKSEIEGTGSATITTDLLGFEDDSLLGFRLIIATGATSNWRPASVIQAPLCARGVSADGLCL